MVYFTSSWDDGALPDMKLAYLMDKYEQEATFYIPLRNVENRAVISSREIEMLSKRFEIGAHTMNHKYLDRLSLSEANYEITSCKQALEEITQQQVHGFCFPGGKYARREINLVETAGFSYYRTISQFSCSRPGKLMDTTLQAYNHSKFTYLKHLLKRRNFRALFLNMSLLLRNNRWHELLQEIIERKLKTNYSEPVVIHLWGHSWELEECNMWDQLTIFLQGINSLGIRPITNYQAFRPETFFNKPD